MVETGYYCTMGCPLYICETVVPGTQSDRIDMFIDYEEQIKLTCKEYEEKLEMDHMTVAYDEEENPGEIVMEATILPEQQGDKTQPYYGVDPNDYCLRFCNKLVHNITMDFSADRSAMNINHAAAVCPPEVLIVMWICGGHPPPPKIHDMVNM
jgi:hypothetical protein